MRKASFVVASILLISIGLGAYFFSLPVTTPSSPVGTVRLLITDPPLNQASTQTYDPSIQGIFVTFTRIEIHAAEAGSDSGWHSLTVGSKTVDILQTLSVSDLLGTASLPTGKYDMIRMFADTARVVIDGRNFVYNIPGATHTGLKVPIVSGGFMLTAGGTVSVLLSLSFNNHEILAQQHGKNMRNLVPVVTAGVQ